MTSSLVRVGGLAAIATTVIMVGATVIFLPLQDTTLLVGCGRSLVGLPGTGRKERIGREGNKDSR